jgi:hypothetical protein
LRCLRKNVWQKRQNFGRNHNWLLLHDNMPTHMSLKATASVTSSNMVLIPHLPFLPDLAPVISLCFRNWKWNSRDDILKHCLTFKGNRKHYSTALSKISSAVPMKRRRNYGFFFFGLVCKLSDSTSYLQRTVMFSLIALTVVMLLIEGCVCQCVNFYKLYFLDIGLKVFKLQKYFV